MCAIGSGVGGDVCGGGNSNGTPGVSYTSHQGATTHLPSRRPLLARSSPVNKPTFWTCSVVTCASCRLVC